MRRALLMLSCLVASAAPAGEIYKCRNADGSLAFLDHPCAGQAQSLDVPKLPSELPFAWRCGKDEPPAVADKDEFAAMPEAQRKVFGPAMAGLGYGGGEVRLFFDRARNIHACADGTRGKGEVVLTPEGHIWANRDGKVQRLDRYDRLSRLAACSEHITACFQPGVRGLDQCAYAAPVCTTSEPVEGEPACCAAACIARFRELRAQDVDPMSALDRALYDNEACSGVPPDPSRRR